MVVWLVNPFDNLPHEGARLQRYPLLADAFAAAGHETVLWSAAFSHTLKKPRVPPPPDGAGRGWRLELLPVPPYRTNVSLRRFASHRAFGAEFLRAGLSCGRRPDLIVASAPPLSSAAAAIALRDRFGCKAVIDVQDAWPETFERLLPLPGGVLRRAAARAAFAPLFRKARAVYRAADGIAAVSRRYFGIAAAAGSKAPFHLARLAMDIGPRPARRPRDPSAPLRVAYAGNMGRTYDLATAIAAVKSLPGAELELAGAGPCEARLRRLAAGCPRIAFRGYLGADALADMLARADAGLVPMFPDAYVGVPGKFSDYAAAGLPIVDSLPGEAAELLERHGAGFRYRAGSESSLRAALCAAAAMAPEALAAAGERARDMAEAEFSAKTVYPRFVEFAAGL